MIAYICKLTPSGDKIKPLWPCTQHVNKLPFQVCECETKPACDDIMCTMFCEHGFQHDENGCEICQCNNCPQMQCMMFCEHGFKKDSDGCEVIRLQYFCMKELEFPIAVDL